MADRLFFLDVQGRRMFDAVWVGPTWPPPERLSVLKGTQSGEISVVEEDIAPADLLAAARELGSIVEMRFRLRNASTLPEAAPEGAHWFRGAEYIPEGDD